MDDTSPAFKALYRQAIMKRSSDERLLMGDGMFESARKLVLASLPCAIADDEKRFLLFLRFYDKDFLPSQKARIKKRIMRDETEGEVPIVR